MSSITTSAQLKQAIQELEWQQAQELNILREQYHITREALKPANMLSSMLRETIADPALKTDALDAAIGFSSGMLARKLLTGHTANPFRKLLGMVVEMAVAGKTVKNAGGIKAAGSLLFNALFKRKTSPVKVPE